jgi:hypothetical protein
VENLSFIGGAKVGRRRSTWPLAKLDITPDRIDLNVSILKYAFQPGDITSVKIVSYTSLFSSDGLQFNHHVESYPNEIIFLCNNAQYVLQTIAATGFFEKTFDKNLPLDNNVIAFQKQGALSVKKPVFIFLIVIWNLLLIPVFLSWFFPQLGLSGYHTELVAFAMIFVVSILTLTVQPFRNLILKDGRTKADVSTFFYLIALISILLFASFYFNSKIGQLHSIN